jgi:hypothetical protein
MINLLEEFRLLYLTHRWLPVDVSPSKMSLLYDLSAKVSFELNGDAFYPKISISNSDPEFLVCFSISNL